MTRTRTTFRLITAVLVTAAVTTVVTRTAERRRCARDIVQAERAAYRRGVRHMTDGCLAAGCLCRA
ncbi:hypothetical protein [Streptomyces buecherae]|uniref:hypothetical protein n=1 Tax=Streptomyces buecherae TaxID=2763006 RepID=UPI0036AD56B4